MIAPAAWAEALVAAVGNQEDAVEALDAWCEGPFRPSDYPPAAVRLLEQVAPYNAERHVAALAGLL